MVYVEYEKCKQRLNEIQEAFDKALLEKERLFARTQPNAVRYDKDVVQVSHGESYTLENYVIESEKIDRELNIYREILVDRERLLTLKEKDLRASVEIADRVYVMRYLDGYGSKKIMKSLSYGKSQYYRIIREIDSKREKMGQNGTKWDKMGQNGKM